MGSRPTVSGRLRAPSSSPAANGVKAKKNGAIGPRLANGDAPQPRDVIRLTGVTKSFGRTSVMSGVSFSVAPGELVEITGPSGSGKTTLLRLIHGQLRPSAGEVWLEGRSLHRRWRRGLGRIRREVAFVFQDQHLLPRLCLLYTSPSPRDS